MSSRLGILTLMAAGATALIAAQPSPTQPVSGATGQTAAVTFQVPAEIAAAYEKYRIQPIWTRHGLDESAVSELISILQRAPFDGYAEGPRLAAEVQAAAEQARSGDAGTLATADQALSAAWVRYVQAIRQPTQGMIYAVPFLKPHAPPAEQILLTTAAASSLQHYLRKTSEVNPIYAQLRDAGWAAAQASGDLTPDPRLLANLDRLRSIPAKGRFLLVDSGSSMLTLYDNGEAVDSMKVITGTRQLPTPLIASVMYYITYNPYWHAPDHLVRKTIAPTFLRQGIRYFKSHGYQVIDEWSPTANEIDPTTVDWKAAAAGTLHLRIRQDPGPLNSMGDLKFPFPNSEDIYLHDTPSRGLFAKENRNLSNGCVRVEDPKRLGRWLLGHDPEPPGTDAETNVSLPEGMPIYLTYITAEVVDGQITYLPDLYGWDSAPPSFASVERESD